MCKAALAHKGLWNSWKNTELSKNTKEDAVASRRNQISKCKAHEECDPTGDGRHGGGRQVGGTWEAGGRGAADLLPVPRALASRAARVKVFLPVVGEQSPFRGPLSLHLKLCKA